MFLLDIVEIEMGIVIVCITPNTVKHNINNFMFI